MSEKPASMKRVLVYEGKHCQRYYDVSTPELENAAYVALFRYLDEDELVYDYEEGDRGLPHYLRAQAGDATAARQILKARRSYEYEGWRIEPVQPSTPPTPQDELRQEGRE